MNLFCHYKTICLITILLSPALPILFQIHRIYHGTKNQSVTHNIKDIKYTLLGNKNVYTSSTKNKRKKSTKKSV